MSTLGSTPTQRLDSDERLQIVYQINYELRKAEEEGLPIDTLVKRVLQIASAELQANHSSLFVLSPTGDVAHAGIINDKNVYTNDSQLPVIKDVLRDGIAGQVIRSQSEILISNTQTDERWLRREDHPTDFEPWSAIAVPLKIRNRVNGSLTVTKSGACQFDEHDSDLLRLIADQAAIKIENARILAELAKQIETVEALNEAGKALNSSLELQTMLETMFGEVNTLLEAEAISVALYDESDDKLHYEAATGGSGDSIVGYRQPLSHGIAGWVFRNEEAVLVNDPYTDTRFDTGGDNRTGTATRAIMCAPLMSKERTIGTIQAVNPVAGTFSKVNFQLLVNLSNLASSAIANAKQFSQTLAAERRYTELFEDSIDPIIITDLEGVIAQVNRRGSEFVGYSTDGLIGHPVDDFHASPVFEEIQRALADLDNGQFYICEGSIYKSDKARIPVQIHAKITQVRHERLIQWIYHDMTEQVALEKMRNDLTAMLYHDLQNPLSTVLASLELLEMELEEGPTVDQEMTASILDTAMRSGERLRNMVRTLLDINRLELGKPISSLEAIPVTQLITPVVEVVRPNSEARGVTIATQEAENIPVVHADRDMIERVLINLLDNALKFSDRDDTITVSVEMSGDSHVTFAVSDEGPGIPESYREMIFAKFFRTPDNNRKGIGLGLAFCEMAIEAHKGEIWVDEAEGGGARFQFTLPIA